MKKTIYIALGVMVVGAVAFFTLKVVANRYVHRAEPAIKQYAIDYLEKRFKSKVELANLRVHLGSVPPIRAYWNKGRGVGAMVEGDGLVMHAINNQDALPLFSIRHFTAEFDLGTLLDSPRLVPKVMLVGLEINVPPKGERPDINQAPSENSGQSQKPSVISFGTIEVREAVLRLLPKAELKRKPLIFDIQRLVLHGVAASQAMQYEARLINPKPPGVITSNGSFGPWNADEPGASPLGGTYEFKDADLGVFTGIAGILHSTGEFHGELSSVEAKGTATVPDFRLKRSGNKVPLTTEFEAEVDGTNGDTVLKPVNAILGTTHFRTQGAIIKQEAGAPRAIDLTASMPAGDMRDVLRLAMKGPAMMQGTIELNTKIHLPPFSGVVKDKLVLDGTFKIAKGLFRQDKIQDKVDELSRRAQGEPQNLSIDDTFSAMKGDFHLENGQIDFRNLSFNVPGAGIRLVGSYDMNQSGLDFLGTVAFDAKASQMLTGWKHWLVKPFDPLLSKNGAGTFLGVSIKGDVHKPDFKASRSTHAAEEALASGQIAKDSN